MSDFIELTQHIDQCRLPPRVVKLPLSAWASGYDGRPECDVDLGLRLPSQDDIEAVDTESLRASRAAESEEESLLTFVNERVVGIVGRCICSPTDVSMPHDLFETPDALLRIALTPQGVRWVFDQVERLQLETSPLFAEATDGEIEELFGLIIDGEMERIPNPVIAARTRRYLGLCLEALRDSVTSRALNGVAG